MTHSTQTPVKALQDLGTSHVSDAMDRLGIAGQCLGIMPLDRSFHLAGPAFTVRYVPVGTDPGSVGDYIDDLDPGTVVVLDNAGRPDTTVWGDLLTATASRRELGGTVIDGVCRDSDSALELSYPVYSRGRWMRTGKDRVRVDGYRIPVTVGGVRIEAGDLLLGDADGVVAVPASRSGEVIAAAEEIRDAENRIRADIEQGAALAEARAKAGYHRLQTPRRSGT
ncbi:RraA family protein [Streptomyces chartreusis]|uniref:Putative 4-hydroxy-4-methyl-2-oxoglutarate aldolase n=1 Tax=Streptomyces chartreusis TaxID=1969 RepID=A0A7I0NSK5_STRCX|nr:RraA family protein [Streptomyces chartreusis]QKZ16048.1 RraA family protein [Streptomyces chartreusis]